MIELRKDYAGLKNIAVVKELPIFYLADETSYGLYLVSDPWFWSCAISKCREEITLRAQIEAESGADALPTKSLELNILEDFEANFKEAANVL